MSKRTAVNEPYKGLVESFAIPAEIHERDDGRKYASFGAVVPIHCCSPEQVTLFANTTHHYCDIFTDEVLAPLGELAYVRLDEEMAEKVFINRSKRILVLSGDGVLAQWRAAPTFESNNTYLAGTPIVDKDGALVSVVTARRGNHYAVSAFEGEGGYFDTPSSWSIVTRPEHGLIYGEREFATREELRAYVESLPPAHSPPAPDAPPPRPVLHAHSTAPRLALVASTGRQLAHYYLQGVLTTDVEYL